MLLLLVISLTADITQVTFRFVQTVMSLNQYTSESHTKTLKVKYAFRLNLQLLVAL